MTAPSTAVGLDIGSNTISCCRLSRHPDGRPVVEQDASLAVRLSEGLQPGGRLKTEAVARALDALERLHAEFCMDEVPVRAAATAVLRMTAAPRDFLDPAERILGGAVDVISGEEEARLTCRGAVLDLPPDPAQRILDIGGQSTELSSRTGDNGCFDAVSMPLGVVALTERFFTDLIISDGQRNDAASAVRDILKAHVPDGGRGALVCVGGTPTTLCVLNRGLRTWQRESVHGAVISREAAEEWLRILSAVPPEERVSRFGMRPLRADVFPAGLLILIEVMRHTGVSSFMVSANGLRVGLALSVIEGEDRAIP